MMYRFALSPGTEIMYKIHQTVCHFASAYCHEYKDVKVVVSGYNVFGEGEIKIMEYINQLEDESVLIHTNDSDMIVLGIFGLLV